MTDEDKCSHAAKLFYQTIEEEIKKNPDFIIDDITSYSYDWAVNCGFDNPRCFVKYIEDIEYEKETQRINEKLNRDL